MKTLLRVLSLLLMASSAPAATPKSILTNAQAIASYYRLGKRPSAANINIVGTVVRPRILSQQTMVVEDDSGAVEFRDFSPYKLSKSLAKAGDIIHIRGTIRISNKGSHPLTVDEVKILGHGPAPTHFKPVSLSDIVEDRCFERTVCVAGTIIDAHLDETDLNYGFLMINDGTNTVMIAHQLAETGRCVFDSFIGASVQVRGTVSMTRNNKRRLAPHVILLEPTNAITVIRSPEENTDSAPPIDNFIDTPLSSLASRSRMRAHGLVLAHKGQNSIILQTATEVCRIDLLTNDRPAIGSFVEAIGIPEINLYQINLIRAIWRPASNIKTQSLTVKHVLAKDLPWGGTILKSTSFLLHGQLVNIAGKVYALPNPDNDEKTLLIISDNYLVPVDVNTIDTTKLAIGCTVSITGLCVVNIEPWRSFETLSRIQGFSIIPRSENDILILSRPSWWTPGRLFVVIGVLITILCGFALWIFLLNRLSLRKGRQLAKMEIEKVSAELRTDERSRLAIELHDTLAQNLTGVSMEIETASRYGMNKPDEMLRHLEIANTALKSCRSSLRDNLWDLRSRALEAPDMNTAIRLTLLPHLKDMKLSVNFETPRAKLTDRTTHHILCIIRELTINAKRHGEATKIDISGTFDKNVFRIIVTDNGRGFDPQNVPGVKDGHFGIQGMRERLNEIAGELGFSSTPAKGTTATITIKL